MKKLPLFLILLLLLLSLGFIGSVVADTYSTFKDNLISKTSKNSFEGKLNINGVDIPVFTTFYIGYGGKIFGGYIFHQDSDSYIGSLSDCRVLDMQVLNCVWIDESGDGEMKVTFSKDFDSFNGFWNDSRDSSTNYIWNGKRF